MYRVTEENVIAFLKANGFRVADDARAGLREATQLMQVYEMYHRSPDHPTLGVLLGAVDSWLMATPKTVVGV